MFFQNGLELPDLYTMSIYPTIVGGFPNYFMEMDLADSADFLRGLRDVQSLADWIKLRDRYGILRNSARFWPPVARYHRLRFGSGWPPDRLTGDVHP